MADDYDAKKRELEDLIIEYYDARSSGNTAGQTTIENTIVDEKGWMTSEEFSNEVDDNYYAGPGGWGSIASSVADDSINTLIENAIKAQAAEQGKAFWKEGARGGDALALRDSLETQLRDAEALQDDVLAAALRAELQLLGEGTIEDTDGNIINLTAIETGEVDKWDISPGALAEKLRWTEQCVLSSNIEELSTFHNVLLQRRVKARQDAGIDSPSAYDRIHLLGGTAGDEGSSRLIVNKLHARTDMEAFLDIKPYEMSQLTPKVEIWKTLYRQDEKELTYLDEVRVPFPAHSIYNPEASALETARSDYGITAASWKFHGSNPDLVRNDIEAWITFYFQGFDSMVAKHTSVGSNGATVDWSYLDLIGFGHGSLSKEDVLKGVFSGTQDNSAYEIKANFGYNLTPSTFSDVEDPARREKLVSAAKAQQVTLFLNLIDHTIDVQDMGTVVIKCHYRGRLDSILADPRADVLADTAYKNEIKNLSNDIEKAKEKRNTEALKSAQERYNTKIEEVRRERLGSIITKLEDRGHLYNIEISPESLGQFAASGVSSGFKLPSLEDGLDKDPYGDELMAKFKKGLAQTPSDSEDLRMRLQHVKPDGENQENRAIHFFYFGDLIEVLCDIAFERETLRISELNEFVPEVSFSQEKTDKIKIVLGPFEYEKVLCGEPKSVNLASVPISADRFIQFFYDSVMASPRTSFPLLLFVRQIINELLLDSLGEACKRQEKSNSMTINTMTIDAPASQDGRDPMASLLDRQNREVGDTGGILRISYLDPIATEKTTGTLWSPLMHVDLLRTYNYLMIYTQQSSKASLSGSPLTDKSNGIHHLYIGSSRGLLKQVSFQKTDMAYLREARYQTVSDNPYYSLSNRYNISVSLFGNHLFYPGTYLYLNPLGLGSELGDPSSRSSIARAMGIGGYHFVTSVSHQIEGGSYSTTVTALWESSGGGRQFCRDLEESGEV